MLVKHYINGIVKPQELQEESCSGCNNGKGFEQETHIRTREFGWENSELICGTCDSKYIVPRAPATMITGSYCASCQFQDGRNCLQETGVHFCKGRIPSYLDSIKEVNQMDEQLIKDLDIFRDTRKCPQHHWITSEPFTTGEGKFVVTCCAVCHLARVNYNGQIYEDKVMKIVSWLADRGIKKPQPQAPIVKKYDGMFENLGLNTTVQTPTIPKIEDIFSLVPDQLPPLNFGL